MGLLDHNALPAFFEAVIKWLPKRDPNYRNIVEQGRLLHKGAPGAQVLSIEKQDHEHR